VRDLVEAATAAPSAGDGGDAVAMAGAGPPPRRSLALTALAFVLLRGVRLLARGLLRLRVEGAEHLRPPAAALVCSNHQSFLDIFLVLSLLPWPIFRRTGMVAKPRYVGPLLPLVRRIGLVPIDARPPLPPALQARVAPP